MNLFNAIENRRAVKQYVKNETIPDETFEKIMSSVILSPTSYNIQHWRFVRVRDKALRAKLKDAAWGQSQVEDAAELLVLCANTNAWQDRPERYWANADNDTQSTLLSMLNSFYSGKEQLQRDEAIRSCGIAAQTLMLTAKAMGYDTCPMIGFDANEFAKLINLPEGHIVTMIITIGTAAESAFPRGGQLPLSEVLIENCF